MGPTLSNTEFLLHEGKARHQELLEQAQWSRTRRLLKKDRVLVVCRLLTHLGGWLTEKGMQLQERAERKLILQTSRP